MPTIFNIGNSYNINNKKISSKLTFESGERFSGRVVRKDGNDSVIIKLRDGWEFNAEIEDEISDFNGFQRFEVVGFEDGKLKLKLLSKNIENNNKENSIISNMLLKNGLGEEDTDLIKDMLKFNIPINKESIKEIKGLINFLNRLSINSNEGKEFISKFLASKGLDENSIEGQNIKTLLNNFFDDYKSMTKEDVLLFYENNIDFNSENIKAYNNIFNGENKLFNNINDLQSIFNDEGLSNKLNREFSEEDNNVLKYKDINNSIKEDYKNNEKNIESKIASNSYQKLDGSSKINLLSILKSISGYEEEYLNTALKDILSNNKEKFNNIEFDKAFSIIENISSKEFIDDIKKELSNYSLDKENNLKFNKSDIENLLLNKLGKFIELNEKEFIKIKDIINLASKDIEIKDNNEKSISTEINNVLNKEIEDRYIDNKLNMDIKENIKDIGSIKKEVLKDVINLINDLKEEVLPKDIANFLKNNINEIKLFNKLSLEYYYADIPININQKDYPCKIIIKDKRKDDKRIDGSNVKMIITIDTSNLGIIDGYIKVLNKKLDIELKCEEKYTKLIEENKEILNLNIKRLGFLVNINISKKENEVSLSNCREFFNEEFGVSLDRKV